VSRPSASTTLAVVIGDPVRHSKSPAVHNAAFAATGLDWVYVAMPVPEGSAATVIDAMRVAGWGGMSVTMPHKHAAAAAADERSGSVDRLGAANCLVPTGDGGVRAENTDGAGFLAGLRADAGFDVADRRVVVFGAGGAARAVIDALAGAGVGDVAVVNRNPDRAEAAAGLAGAAGRLGSLDDVDSADLVINATPRGMGDDDMPCPPERIDAGQVVVDLIYGDAPTRWVRELRAAGVSAHDGQSMLVHQAAVAFTHWTGVIAPVEVMRAAMSD